MATGDQNDMAARLRALLPAKWFADAAPVLSAVLAGFGSVFAAVYSLIAYVKAQMRIGTATGFNLDLVATDFFGLTLQRRALETDAAFRTRISANLFAPANTRAAAISALTALTGRVPTVFEPAQPGDTGVYGGYAGYGAAGGYGSYSMPFVAFVHAYRPSGGGVSMVQGYGYGSGAAQGGYGQGALEYISTGQTSAAVPDSAIYAAVDAVRPSSVTAWVKISS